MHTFNYSFVKTCAEAGRLYVLVLWKFCMNVFMNWNLIVLLLQMLFHNLRLQIVSAARNAMYNLHTCYRLCFVLFQTFPRRRQCRPLKDSTPVHLNIQKHKKRQDGKSVRQKKTQCIGFLHWFLFLSNDWQVLWQLLRRSWNLEFTALVKVDKLLDRQRTHGLFLYAFYHTVHLLQLRQKLLRVKETDMLGVRVMAL